MDIDTVTILKRLIEKTGNSTLLWTTISLPAESKYRCCPCDLTMYEDSLSIPTITVTGDKLVFNSSVGVASVYFHLPEEKTLVKSLIQMLDTKFNELEWRRTQDVAKRVLVGLGIGD